MNREEIVKKLAVDRKALIKEGNELQQRLFAVKGTIEYINRMLAEIGEKNV